MKQMPLEVILTTGWISEDPARRELIEHLRASQDRLGLGAAILYYDFPTYLDFESVTHKPDAPLLVSEARNRRDPLCKDERCGSFGQAS